MIVIRDPAVKSDFVNLTITIITVYLIIYLIYLVIYLSIYYLWPMVTQILKNS